MAKWRDADVRILRKLYPDLPAREVAGRLGVELGVVYRKAHALGLRKSEAFKTSDLSERIKRGKQLPSMKRHQFSKGQAAWNKGAHYQPGGRCKETQFKPGDRKGAAARKWQPIGTERIAKDGILERKVHDAGQTNRERQRRWVPVHRLVWEAANGPIPQGSIVVFMPGCHTTTASEITPDKLEVITRAENMRRNSYLTRYPKEVADAIRLRGALIRKINLREQRA